MRHFLVVTFIWAMAGHKITMRLFTIGSVKTGDNLWCKKTYQQRQQFTTTHQ